MSESQSAEVIIIGAGPGGIATAIWCQRLGLSSILLEREQQIGGQLSMIHTAIPDLPGLFVNNGSELRDRLEEHLRSLDIKPRLGVKVTSINPDTRTVHTNQGVFQGRAIVVATGVRRRKLPMEEAIEFEERGLSYTASGDPETFRGKKTAIIGGGDGAFENALKLAETCPEVHVLFRRDKPSARPSFVQAARQNPRIHLCAQTIVTALHGNECLEAVSVEDSWGKRRLEVGALLVKIGFEPASRFLNGRFKRKLSGHMLIDAHQKTSNAYVWAVGDVCTPEDPSLSVAMGQACIAARQIERMLRH